ncbi:hypothetical protein BRADI_1g08290v3 [Brachypodium distachyon]|uniref:Uncharacterized protein n=1 Tax=Brachypodium distachyon TaxID=15368 RepID=A0A0Q3RIZ9_BRADI|nr:hypothetical protein BRADI_1g08290v3 [Brachypodium distachyon]
MLGQTHEREKAPTEERAGSGGGRRDAAAASGSLLQQPVGSGSSQWRTVCTDKSGSSRERQRAWACRSCKLGNYGAQREVCRSNLLAVPRRDVAGRMESIWWRTNRGNSIE